MSPKAKVWIFAAAVVATVAVYYLYKKNQLAGGTSAGDTADDLYGTPLTQGNF